MTASTAGSIHAHNVLGLFLTVSAAYAIFASIGKIGLGGRRWVFTVMMGVFNGANAKGRVAFRAEAGGGRP